MHVCRERVRAWRVRVVADLSRDLGLINTICMIVIAVSVAVIAIHGPRR